MTDTMLFSTYDQGDLVERLKTEAPLAQIDPGTIYGGGAKGYIDYPAATDAVA